MVVTPNLDHLRMLETDEALVGAYRQAKYVVADGMPLVWLSKLLRKPLPERVSGSDLLYTISEEASKRSVPIYLCGGLDGSAGLAASALEEQTGVEVAGVACPEVRVPSRKAAESIAADIEATGARIVFLAFGAPKQEILATQLGNVLPRVWFVGVGGSFEMAANRVARAPGLLQRLGLEWLFRLQREPSRLFRRYILLDLPYFVGLTSRTVAERYRNRSAEERKAS
jgi:exopolysaccharide biosynthesis WecB/TagA/CpsF family protein